MSPIAWVATILILAPTSSTATTPAVVLPANAVLLGEPTASGLTRQCSRSNPDFEATWTPSVAEILQLESDLGLRWTQLFGPISASAKRDLLGSGSSFYFNAGSGSSQ